MSVEKVGLKQKWDNLSQGQKTAAIAGGAVAAVGVGSVIAAGIKGHSMATKAIDALKNNKSADEFVSKFKDVDFNQADVKVGLFKKIGAGYKSFGEGIKNAFNKLFHKNNAEETKTTEG